jgi:hypothetical protein
VKTAKKKKRESPDIAMVLFLYLSNFSQTFVFVKKHHGGGGNRTRVRRYSAERVYMLILFYNLILRRPKRMNTTEPALMQLRSPGSGQSRFAILLVGVSEAPQESAKETACLLLRQQQADFLHFCFPPFYEVGGISTCDLYLIISVDTCSPPSLRF